MYQKFARAFRNLHRGQRGMTGLETAIILIAFVTVASVLAYSVLSAGIFSAEKGKSTVYSGLEQVSATMEVKGSVLGYSSDNTVLTTTYIWVGLVMPDEELDMGSLILTYADNTTHQQLSEGSDWSYAIDSGSTERGTAVFMERDEIHKITVNIDSIGATLNGYEWFMIQIVPPTGASIEVHRILPGQLTPMMDLK